MEMTSAQLIKRHAAAVPRYTSYPTAPHFDAGIGPADYSQWLESIPEGLPLSLYVHIPFCHTLCWYCGCNTKMTKRYDPVALYLPSLHSEIAAVAKRLPQRHRFVHIQWGGGSPNILEPDDIIRVAGAIQGYMSVDPMVEFGVEVDPRHLSREQAAAYARAGVTRGSIGVQDFDPEVQQAINRIQTFGQTRAAIELLRDLGIGSVNIDLVYGLPYQTLARVESTIAQVISLRPDRVALFGYAHLPERLVHQRMIPDQSLPDATARFAQSTRAAEMLVSAGYCRIGLDHFALPDDSMAKVKLHRDFQGYTTDKGEALIGLGASAIGRLPQGYVQNAVATGEYARRIGQFGLATARGRRLTADDRIRALAIERLMCDLRFPGRELRETFGAAADLVRAEAEALLGEPDLEGLLVRTEDGFSVTEKGRPFVRSVCARFDAYLKTGKAKHSMGV